MVGAHLKEEEKEGRRRKKQEEGRRERGGRDPRVCKQLRNGDSRLLGRSPSALGVSMLGLPRCGPWPCVSIIFFLVSPSILWPIPSHVHLHPRLLIFKYPASCATTWKSEGISSSTCPRPNLPPLPPRPAPLVAFPITAKGSCILPVLRPESLESSLTPASAALPST